MGKTHTRAMRRHHLARLKAKRSAYYGGYIKALPLEEQQRHLGILAHTARRCSCPLCGNPRKHWHQATWQEKRRQSLALSPCYDFEQAV